VHTGSTWQYRVSYKVTFLDAGYGFNQQPLIGSYQGNAHSHHAPEGTTTTAHV
jgi:hypothetical protein